MAELSRTSKEQFDKQAAHYDSEWNTWSEHTLTWLVKAAAPKPSDFVLDVATGTGFTARALAGLVSSVVAADVSTGMLEQAASLSAVAGIENIQFVEAPAEELPFDDSVFDIVTCRIAAHHFVSIEDFAAESYRVLQPGGRLVIVDTSVPDNDFLAAIWQNEVERLRDPSHGKNYTVREWRKILGRPGFEIVTADDTAGGIRIPLTSWITKAGCTEEQEKEVRAKFADASQNIRSRYSIETDEAGETWFTWLRVSILAVKPA